MSDSPALVEARRKYREKHRQISVTVTEEVYQMMLLAAETDVVSNAEYVRSLIIADYKKKYRKKTKFS